MELNGLSESAALSKTAKQLGIVDMGVKGLASRLVYEATRSKNFLDSLINTALKPHSVADYDLGVQAFLRLYAYETRIARKRKVFQDAVEISRMGRAVLGWEALQPVEKALGRLLTVESKDAFVGVSDLQRVALLRCLPVFFVQCCFRLFGRHEALKVLTGFQRPLPVYVRLNTQRASEEAIFEALKKDEIDVQRIYGLSHLFRLVKPKQPLLQSRSFREGLFVVQDLASCLAVEAAVSKTSAVVFDVCAAPGLKTSYVSMQMQNGGKLYALDYSKRGLRALKVNAARLGLKNVNLILGDARVHLPYSGAADLVILDPPCSESGVLARTPSLKWRLSPELVARMVEIQWQMLRSCADFVKVGGSLVYFTNSIFVEENEMLVERFLRVFPDFGLVDTLLPMGSPGLRGLEKCRRFYPHIHNCEGAFIARLCRVF